MVPVDQDTLQLIQAFAAGAKLVTVDGRTPLFNIKRIRAWQIFVEAAMRAGLPQILNPDSGITHNVSPHKLRDAFAVQAIKTDNTTDGARLLQEQLGHQNIATTMHYRKVSGQDLQAWHEKVVKEGPSHDNE